MTEPDPDVNLREDRVTVGSRFFSALRWASDLMVMVAGTGVAVRLGDALATIMSGGGGGNPGVEGIIQNNGNPIVPNQQFDWEIQSDCTLGGVTLLADGVGSAVINFWKCTYAQFNDTTHPVAADKITGSNPPTISGGVKYKDPVLNGWNTTLTKGDVLRCNVDNAAGITRLTISLSFIVPVPTPGGSIVTENGSTVKLSQMPTVTPTSTTKLAALTDGLLNGVCTVASIVALAAGAVTQIIAGANVTISPVGGTGAVTINSSGGGGGSVPANGKIKQYLSNSAANSPVWLDGMINLSNPAFGNISTDSKVCIQAGIDYCYANGIGFAYCPANYTGANFWNITGPLFNDPPNNLRQGISLANQKLGQVATPGVFGVGMTLFFEWNCTFFFTNNADGTGGTFDTCPFIWMGTQNANRLVNFYYRGPAGQPGFSGCRTLHTACTGIAIASGNGGATDTVIEDCRGYNNTVYAGVTMGQNGENALAENNRFYNCTLSGAYAMNIINGQALVNWVFGGSFGGDLVTFNNIGQSVHVIGGEHGGLQPGASTTRAMTCTGTLTGFSNPVTGGGAFTNYTIDLVMGSGTFAPLNDGTFFYNAGYINLPNYPYTPIIPTAWNGGTNTLTCKIEQGWLFHNFGEELLLPGTTFSTELAAAVLVTLVPRTTLLRGSGELIGCHVESLASTALYSPNGNGARFVARNLETTNWHLTATGDTGLSYTNLIFPWIVATGDTILEDWTHPPDAEINGLPFLIQFFDYNSVASVRQVVSNCGQMANTNMRYVGSDTNASGQKRGPCFPDPNLSYVITGTKAFGGMEWDYDYWLVSDANTITDQALMGLLGTRRSPHIGYRPAPTANPRITTADISAIIAKVSAPNMFGNTLYQVAQNSAADVTHVLDVGGSGSTDYTSAAIDWNCVAGSTFVNLPTNNANARRYLYPGREIILNTPTPTPYIVAGTFLTLATGLPIAGMNFIQVFRASTTASVIGNGVDAAGTAYSGATISSRDPVLSFPGQTRTARVSGGNFSTTTDGVLHNVTGLTKNVFAGKTYKFRAVLYTTSNVAAGVQEAIAGTATATAIAYEAVVYQGGVAIATGTPRASALATKVGDVTAVTTAKIEVDGTITVNASGTLTVQLGQNAANGAATVALIGSSFDLVEIA